MRITFRGFLSERRDGSRVRVISPLSDTAVQMFRELHQKTGSRPYVFAHLEGKFEGRPITDIRNAFNAAVARAKIHRYSHLSPRYLADEVKTLDLFQQDGKLQTKPNVVQTITSDHDDQDPREDQGYDEH